MFVSKILICLSTICGLFLSNHSILRQKIFLHFNSPYKIIKNFPKILHEPVAMPYCNKNIFLSWKYYNCHLYLTLLNVPVLLNHFIFYYPLRFSTNQSILLNEQIRESLCWHMCWFPRISIDTIKQKHDLIWQLMWHNIHIWFHVLPSKSILAMVYF